MQRHEKQNATGAKFGDFPGGVYRNHQSHEGPMTPTNMNLPAQNSNGSRITPMGTAAYAGHRTVEPFSFEGAQVRVLRREGEPWFVLADICRVLEIGNPSDAARRLDEDEKDALDNIEGIADARVQALTIINESGLYSLILTSRKEALF